MLSLTEANYPLYKKLLRDYEGYGIERSDNTFYVNGIEQSQLVIKQNYYWMMGDNRDHSEDSRSWGFVPENHILGKPVFIWMSWDNFNEGIFSMKPRWERFFTTVKGPGQPRSYLFLLIIGLVSYYGYRFYKKRK